VTSAYSSYSGCRQYLDDIETARAQVGPGAPQVVKLRPFFNHPGFVAALSAALRTARADAGPDAALLMTGHSIPVAMSATCDYERQLHETAALTAEAAGEPPGSWSVVYQSRSGPPGQAWLGPDVADAIDSLPDEADAVVIAPIGFVSDHMEVVYDLDRAATAAAAERGIRLVRSATPGTDPRFVAMICDLVEEADGLRPPAVLGDLGPVLCPCATGCRPGPA
jgi:protoporphyrin/coproporphyrin ferrochelatase